VLLLEDVAESEQDLPGVGAEESVAVDPEPPVPLSKFRQSAPRPSPRPRAQEVRAEVKEPPPDPNRTTLGRLKLAKRRMDGGEAPSKPSAIRRLLSSF
jgi:hypothetical protein